MSLPEPWIDRIFDKLTLTYGQAFLRRWADIDLNAVKSDWGHELAGFAQHPRAIAWALQSLPTERPPTVLEFRALARRAPAEDVPRLPQPQADPARVAAELQKLAPLRQVTRQSKTFWAHRIIAKAASGEPVSRTVMAMATDAARRYPQ